MTLISEFKKAITTFINIACQEKILIRVNKLKYIAVLIIAIYVSLKLIL